MKFNEYLLNIMSYMMLGSSHHNSNTIYWKQKKVTCIVLKTFGLFFSL